MKRMFTAVVFSGLLALGVTAAASTANASAIAVGATTSDLVKTVGQSSENIVEVNHRRGHRSHRHRGHRHHADRHHHRHHGRHHRRHRHHHRNRHHWRPGGNFFLQFGVPAAPRIAPAPRRAMPTAHVRWCEKKYRSYRASDNTFQPYNGPRKACVSPYYP